MIHQRLDLHQQRAGPSRPPSRAAGGDFISRLRKIADGLLTSRSLLGHGENAQLIHRAKAVLWLRRVRKRSQHHRPAAPSSQYGAPAPSGPQRTVFGDVADHNDRHAASLASASDSAVSRTWATLPGDDERRPPSPGLSRSPSAAVFLHRQSVDLLNAGFEHIQVRRRQPKGDGRASLPAADSSPR